MCCVRGCVWGDVCAAVGDECGGICTFCGRGFMGRYRSCSGEHSGLCFKIFSDLIFLSNYAKKPTILREKSLSK